MQRTIACQSEMNLDAHDDNDDHHRDHYAHGEAGTDYGYDDRVHYYG